MIQTVTFDTSKDYTVDELREIGDVAAAILEEITSMLTHKTNEAKS